ncbi:hypothetical protein BD779DRAFT_1542630 [Infundibulicybe gibba]|nr:hypothetical protein BD779DRAFT_1542630 [Infundibulicybe gibba]
MTILCLLMGPINSVFCFSGSLAVVCINGIAFSKEPMASATFELVGAQFAFVSSEGGGENSVGGVVEPTRSRQEGQ